MGRTEAQKRAMIKYRANNKEKVNSINNKSNKKKYAECEERREKCKARSKEQYKKKKEQKLKIHLTDVD